MDAQPAQSNPGTPAEAVGETPVLQLAQAGDRLAFRQLVEQHQAQVFGIALRLTGRHADAEELAQDVFLQLHGSLARIESSAHLTHWLLRTVAHRSIDRLRKQAKQGTQLPLEALGESPQAQAPESGHDPVAAAELHRLLLQLQPSALLERMREVTP